MKVELAVCAPGIWYKDGRGTVQIGPVKYGVNEWSGAGGS